MNVLKAMQDTIALARKHADKMPVNGSLGYPHLIGMQKAMESVKMSYGKQCRWLGWAQCAVVASGVATLEEMKEINRQNARDD